MHRYNICMHKTHNIILNESQLNAFDVVAQSGSLTKATRILNLSQPALSRRLQALEEELELTLFDRTPQGITLTESGKKLLQYIQNKKALEEEALNDLKNTSQDRSLSGLIRISGHSSMIEPIAMPTLTPFLIENPQVQVEFSVRDNSVLDEMLNYSKTDIILSNRDFPRKDLTQILIGHEEFVCIESDHVKSRSNVYLDTQPLDQTTELFFNEQKQAPKKYLRSFMHDENGILKGVQLGLGRAIKPRHTLSGVESIRIVRGFQSFKRPVYLRFAKKQYYTKLETRVIEILQKECSRFLK